MDDQRKGRYDGFWNEDNGKKSSARNGKSHEVNDEDSQTLVIEKIEAKATGVRKVRPTTTLMDPSSKARSRNGMPNRPIRTMRPPNAERIAEIAESS